LPLKAAAICAPNPGPSLVGIGCIGCISCIGCIGCIDCISCIGCIGCIGGCII
jgi:hypothetical protein